MSYPASLDSFTTKADGNVVYAAHVNDLQAAIVAVETELGAAPKSIDDSVSPGATPASVAAYLDMVAALLKTISGAANWYSASAAVMKALYSAKGDLLVGTGSGTLAALGVGTDGKVITADSTQASGIKWATPSAGGGGGPGSTVYLNQAFV